MITRLFYFFLIAFVACACLDSKENKVQRFLIQGNDAAARKSFREAKRYYGEALKLDSCFVDAWNNLGTVYYREKHFAEALDAYTNALQCNPRMPDALVNRSNTFYELNKPKEALDDINAFAALAPDTFIVHLSRGLIYTRMQRYDDAIGSFSEVLDQNPKHVETLVNLATVYYYRKSYDSARFYLDRAIAIDDTEANAFNAYALLELDLGNTDEALRRVNQALTLRKNDPYFLNNRGFILIAANSLDKALEDIDNSISVDPYNAWAYRNKGVYFLRKGQPEDALRLLTRAEQMDTTVSKLFYYMAEANFLKGDRNIGCHYLTKSRNRGEIKADELRLKCKE